MNEHTFSREKRIQNWFDDFSTFNLHLCTSTNELSLTRIENSPRYHLWQHQTAKPKKNCCLNGINKESSATLLKAF